MRKILLTFCTALIFAAFSTILYAAPATPVVTEKAKDGNSITIKWNQVASTPTVMCYLVYVNDVKQDTMKVWEQIFYWDYKGTPAVPTAPGKRYMDSNNGKTLEPGKELVYTIYGLTKGTSYKIEVVAIDSSYSISSKSTALNITTAANNVNTATLKKLYPSNDIFIIGGNENIAAKGRFAKAPVLFLSTRNGFDGWHVSRRPIVTFDLTGLTAANVTKATLKMKVSDAHPPVSSKGTSQIHKSPRKIVLFQVEPFGEDTIGYSNRPVGDIGVLTEPQNPWKGGLTPKDSIKKNKPYYTFTGKKDAGGVDLKALVTPVGIGSFEHTNDPAGLTTPDNGYPSPAIEKTVLLTKAVTDALTAGKKAIAFTMVDTTFNTSGGLLIPGKDAYTERMYLEITGTNLNTGIDNSLVNTISALYPNPANQQVTLDFVEAGVYNVKIFDITGKLIQSVVTEYTSNAIISIENLEKGLYVISASKNGEVSKALKLQVE